VRQPARLFYDTTAAGLNQAILYYRIPAAPNARDKKDRSKEKDFQTFLSTGLSDVSAE
jgi:hypothetical protein